MERRQYERVDVSAVGSFYANDDKKYLGDFGGKITDVSENGIRIETDFAEHEELLKLIKIGSVLGFDAVDEYVYFEQKTCDIFGGKAEVVYKNVTSDKVELGCKIVSHSEEFEKYINNRKVAIYISAIKKTNEII